jgi:hypothetical protein
MLALARQMGMDDLIPRALKSCARAEEAHLGSAELGGFWDTPAMDPQVRSLRLARKHEIP